MLGLTPQEPETSEILEDFLTFMRGLISLPLYIPGTPYARAVQVLNKSNVLIALFIKLNENNNNYERLSLALYISLLFFFLLFLAAKRKHVIIYFTFDYLYRLESEYLLLSKLL